MVRAAKEGIVLDLSALWAGPYCGALLAAAGHAVVKVESEGRPDPTRLHTPQLDARLNGNKRRVSAEIDGAELLFKNHSIETVATYDTVPLEVEVGITSALGRRYFELIHNASGTVVAY